MNYVFWQMKHVMHLSLKSESKSLLSTGGFKEAINKPLYILELKLFTVLDAYPPKPFVIKNFLFLATLKSLKVCFSILIKITAHPLHSSLLTYK